MERRVRSWRAGAVRGEGRYVLYWMTAARRLGWNHALEQAVDWSSLLGRPLLVLEALRCDYPWATARTHRFVIDGMADNAAACAARRVAYHPYVEPAPGAGRGLLEALAAQACVVVTDDSPAFFLPRALEAAAERLTVRLDAVDSNGLLPVRAAGRAYATARDFRRFVQKSFDPADAPAADPLAEAPHAAGGAVPAEVARRWPAAVLPALRAAGGLAALPLDHEVAPVAGMNGGAAEAAARLRGFVASRIDGYGEGRNDPATPRTSGLSPYLHFGQLSPYAVFDAVAGAEGWTPAKLAPRPNGARAGWWGMRAGAEAFLDQLVVWRELGLNGAVFLEDYDRYDSLPQWARTTLAEHAADVRPALYSRERLENAATDDAIWNATQRQLRQDGVIHTYLRMLWGKRVLTWTESPEQALALLVELNNRWALDGRDPNSYSGIFWVFGRYDRPWPERAIFGKVRTMTSRSTASKFKLDEYLRRYGGT
jgi:deoxyribodipyrimidine photo-lyase